MPHIDDLFPPGYYEHFFNRDYNEPPLYDQEQDNLP